MKLLQYYSVPLSPRVCVCVDMGLNPVLSLIPMYFKGHPSFQVLADSLRSQVRY